MLARGVLMSSSYSKSQISFKNRARFSSFAPPKNRQATETCTIPYKLRCKTAHTISRRKLMLLRVLKGRPSSGRSSPEKPPPDNSTKKGTILGAVSLIVGTSIGSGILALPQKTSPAGFIPTATSIVLCWVFLVVEALLLAELNTNLRKKRKKDEGEGGDLEVVSVRTMAQETLGDWGGNLATVTYLFLGYTSVVAYTSMSGEILSHLISLPSFTSGSLFTLLMALLMLIGGTNITDQVNQWLTFTMIGLLVMIEVMSVSFGGGSGSVICNWEKVPQTIPVIIFSLVYHDIVPVICAYLGGDLARIRFSILLGSIVPLISLLVWESISLGISSGFDGTDPLELLISGTWRSMMPLVETFSILAVGTSLIGTLLGFSQFYIEQLVNLCDSIQEEPKTGSDHRTRDQTEEMKKSWWENNNLNLLATSIVIFPSMFISALLSDAFSIATDIAGGYCMIVLYGILPPAMAWVRASRVEDDDDIADEGDGFQSQGNRLVSGEGMLTHTMPVLVGIGLFSCAVIVEQVLQDLSQL